jgi:hypothetical protein
MPLSPDLVTGLAIAGFALAATSSILNILVAVYYLYTRYRRHAQRDSHAGFGVYSPAYSPCSPGFSPSSPAFSPSSPILPIEPGSAPRQELVSYGSMQVKGVRDVRGGERGDVV